MIAYELFNYGSNSSTIIPVIVTSITTLEFALIYTIVCYVGIVAIAIAVLVLPTGVCNLAEYGCEIPYWDCDCDCIKRSCCLLWWKYTCLKVYVKCCGCPCNDNYTDYLEHEIESLVIDINDNGSLTESRTTDHIIAMNSYNETGQIELMNPDDKNK